MNGKLSGRGLRAGAVTAAVTLAMAAAVAGCSSPSSSGGTGGNGTRHNGSTGRVSAPATKAAAATRAPGALSGKWSGQYSGNYSGTFNLRWRQSGTHLHGTIHISNPPSTLPLNGIVHGNLISFGTVGSMAITYSGTVSGSSMSGTYKVNGSRGGPWSAGKA